MAENEKNTAEVTETAEKTDKKAEKPADKNEKLDSEGLTKKGRENEAIEAAMEEDETDEDAAGDLILEDTRVSIPLTAENTAFFRSPSGLVSLRLINDKGETEEFERVIAIRCFPVTNPNEFVSIREPNLEHQGRSKEIGMIRKMSELPEDAQALLNEELARRYFTPEITKVNSVKDKFGYCYWDVETSAGRITLAMNNPYFNVRTLEDNSVFINDIDGNCFKITDPSKLDAASLRKIEIFL